MLKQSRLEKGIPALNTYVTREGTVVVPNDHIEDDFQLGIWVGNMRQAYREGIMSSDQINLLESFQEWIWSGHGLRSINKFNEGIPFLESFVMRERHAGVPVNHIENDFKLGAWVVNMRQRYKKTP